MLILKNDHAFDLNIWPVKNRFLRIGINIQGESSNIWAFFTLSRTFTKAKEILTKKIDKIAIHYLCLYIKTASREKPKLWTEKWAKYYWNLFV